MHQFLSEVFFSTFSGPHSYSRVVGPSYMLQIFQWWGHTHIVWWMGRQIYYMCHTPLLWLGHTQMSVGWAFEYLQVSQTHTCGWATHNVSWMGRRIYYKCHRHTPVAGPHSHFVGWVFDCSHSQLCGVPGTSASYGCVGGTGLAHTSGTLYRVQCTVQT